MTSHRVLLLSLVATGIIAFQNCSPPPVADSQSSKGNASQGTGGTGDTGTIEPSAPIGGSGGGSGSGGMPIPTVTFSSSAAVETDCSSANAVNIATISNVSQNILMCAEFALDMPPGSPRYGQTSKCDSAASFHAPDSEWTWNSVAQTWSTATVFRNHPYIVPGSYWIVIKDAQGVVTRSSAALVVKRPGFENCHVAASPVKAAFCSWGAVIGGEYNPPQPCNQSTAGTQGTTSTGRLVTCTCYN